MQDLIQEYYKMRQQAYESTEKTRKIILEIEGTPRDKEKMSVKQAVQLKRRMRAILAIDKCQLEMMKILADVKMESLLDYDIVAPDINKAIGMLGATRRIHEIEVKKIMTGDDTDEFPF